MSDYPLQESYLIHKIENVSANPYYGDKSEVYKHGDDLYTICIGNWSLQQLQADATNKIYIHKSSDGGETWDRIPSPVFPVDDVDLRKMQIISDGHISFGVDGNGNVCLGVNVYYPIYKFMGTQWRELFYCVYDGNDWDIKSVGRHRTEQMNRQLFYRNGNVYMLNRDYSGDKNHRVWKSTDDGDTWSSVELVGTENTARHGTTMDSSGVIWMFIYKGSSTTPCVAQYYIANDTYNANVYEITDGETYRSYQTGFYRYENPNFIITDNFTILAGIDTDNKTLIYKLENEDFVKKSNENLITTNMWATGGLYYICWHHYVNGNNIYMCPVFFPNWDLEDDTIWEIKSIKSSDAGETWELYINDNVRLHEGMARVTSNSIPPVLRMIEYDGEKFYGVFNYFEIIENDIYDLYVNWFVIEAGTDGEIEPDPDPDPPEPVDPDPIDPDPPEPKEDNRIDVLPPLFDGRIMICEYQRTVTAEAGTDPTKIVITGHGLNDADFILNSTRKSTSLAGAERGSRKIVVEDANTLLLSDGVIILGQQAGDNIKLFKFIDRTDMVKMGSINVNMQVGNKGEANLTLVIPIE